MMKKSKAACTPRAELFGISIYKRLYVRDFAVSGLDTGQDASTINGNIG